MRIPDLEHMIEHYEGPLCKNCNRPFEEHIMVAVNNGPYSVVAVYKCMINRYMYATTKGDCHYEEQEC